LHSPQFHDAKIDDNSVKKKGFPPKWIRENPIIEQDTHPDPPKGRDRKKANDGGVPDRFSGDSCDCPRYRAVSETKCINFGLFLGSRCLSALSLQCQKTKTNKKITIKK
jgi:hypothetical protein